MSEGEMIAAIADLRARVLDLEKLEPRVSGLEKAAWGVGGVIATVSFIFGIAADWIKAKFGAG